ncbi:MAG: heavy-metal-associated domain-containing protein [Lentisphaerae bacterium]|nr:heavy-metal-associated domain-containing protein [Lentisphaerota bacterium]
MKTWLTMFGLVLLCGMASCRKHDIRTIKIYVPAMKSDECAELVRNKLAKVPGVMPPSIRTDVQGRSVIVAYDSLFLSMRNVEFAVAELGFAANDIPADKNGAQSLPAGCRD